MARDEYYSYLMRLWRVENDGGLWRVRLQNVETGEVLVFASLEMLTLYLESLGRAAGEPPAADSMEDSAVQ
jgi:hypothetical protein